MDIATSPLIPTLLRDNLLADGYVNLNELGLNNTARRLTEFGNRASSIDRTTLRVAGELDFELTDTMRLAVTSTWGQTDVKQNDNQGINKERARLALRLSRIP